MAEAEWSGEAVADHFEEAVRTLRKLPPVRVTGYFNAWPEIVRSAKEIAAMEPQPMRVLPSTAGDHPARADLRLDALDHRRGAQADLAAGGARPWKAITWEVGCDRTTAWRRWTLALTKIASRLNAHRIQSVATLFCSTSATDRAIQRA